MIDLSKLDEGQRVLYEFKEAVLDGAHNINVAVAAMMQHAQRKDLNALIRAIANMRDVLQMFDGGKFIKANDSEDTG